MAAHHLVRRHAGPYLAVELLDCIIGELVLAAGEAERANCVGGIVERVGGEAVIILHRWGGRSTAGWQGDGGEAGDQQEQDRDYLHDEL